ncbi:MAG: RnfABCDGE type electron transport complex subunit G [Firmicutes bacterium]|nr:RnfABCDGE type electron transport complex subunit G [Bacillota bacterium]
MREISKLGIILAVICAIAAGSLAYVYQTTRPVIEERKVKEFEAALRAVIPEAENFRETKKDGSSFYVATKAGKEIGVAIPVESKGYGSTPITMVVGVDMTGKVLRVKVLGHGETAGLGSKIEQDSFLRQFMGKTPESPLVVGQDIDGISGATISSRGATAGVKKALTGFAALFKK